MTTDTRHVMNRSDLQRLADRAGMLLVEAEGGVLSFHEAKRQHWTARATLALAGLSAVVAIGTALAFAGGLLAGVWALAFRAVAS